MKHFFLVFFLLFVTVCSLAQTQEDFTLSGYIKDAETGETLIGATIQVPEIQKGAFTNEYGFYSIKLPAHQTKVVFSFIGYQDQESNFNLLADTRMDIELAPGAELDEVVVSAESNKEAVQSTQMSVAKLTMEDAKLLPAIFGEVDIIKTMQLKPGIKTGGEGTSGIVVRGGGPDQNLFILDEATVYNPSHLFGFFSTFNSDAIKDVQLYKGGFPAQYGGRLSSVIDVRLKEGNDKKFSGTGGLGLIASRLTLEGPIKKEKSSFIVSGRRTYVDIFTRPINKKNEDDPDYEPIPDYAFHDLNGKVNFKLGEKDRLFISAYYGRDFFKFKGNSFDFNFNWGNTTATVRWNRVYNAKLFSNTTATLSDYNYLIRNNFADLFSFELSSGIRDYTLKTDFFYSPNNNHNIHFGAELTHHQFEVGRFQAGDTDNTFNYNAGQDFDGQSIGVYVSDDFDITDQFKINAGLRFSGFINGPFYSAIEPRFAFRYQAGEHWSFKGSYTHMSQYIHLVSNSAASLPTDIWYPSSKTVTPQRANQVVAGISIALGEKYLLSNEFYYKWNQNQIDFRDGAQLFLNDNLDEEFVFGKGWSYGNEIYFEKTKGQLTGWVAYTLSWARRQFDEINQGQTFSPRFDTRHDFSLVALWKINKRFSLTATWIYVSGSPTTLPSGRTFIQNIPGALQEFVVPLYPPRNSYRMVAYHRLDLGFVWRFSPKWGSSDLTFSIYNAYDRRNPFFITIDSTGENDFGIPLGFQAKQVSLFPILPSVTYNFIF